MEKHNFKRRSIFLCVVLTLFVSMSYCQQLPNFSGDWVLNLSKSKLQAYWTSELTFGNFKINHNEPNFSFWRSFTIKGKDKVTSYAIQTNGQKQKGKHKTIWSLSWKQDTLILIVRRHEMTIDSVRYSLSADKMEFVADERVDTPNMSYHNLWIFDKKSQQNK